MPVLAIHGGPKHVPDGALEPWPPIPPEDEALVLEPLRTARLTWGPHCDGLQTEWKAWNGNRFCWTSNSGTSALHMCVAATGASAGDEIITPAYSWTSSVSCIFHHGCVPVFVDVDFPSANLDPAKIEAAITERTRAILVVHLHGLPCRMDAILDIARRHSLAVIEDCCQAHGALYRGRKVGTLGHCAAFSLNQNKMLTGGEGGLFVTDDEEFSKRAQALVLFGDFREPIGQPGYHAYGLAYMYRNNELAAALARAQLKRLDTYIADARALSAAVTDELRSVPGLILPVEDDERRANGYNYLIRIDPAAFAYRGQPDELREALVKAISAEGAPVGVWQRRILPEMGVIRARDAYGNGYPWTAGPAGLDPSRGFQSRGRVDAPDPSRGLPDPSRGLEARGRVTAESDPSRGFQSRGKVSAESDPSRGFQPRGRVSAESDPYHPSHFPESLRHVNTYFVLGCLRTPNTVETARLLGQAIRKVVEHVGELDIDAVARTADRSLYERGWQQQR